MGSRERSFALGARFIFFFFLSVLTWDSFIISKKPALWVLCIFKHRAGGKGQQCLKSLLQWAICSEFFVCLF